MRHALLVGLFLSVAGCSDEPAGPREPAAATITLTGPASSIVPNEEVALQAAVRAADGSAITAAPVAWTSSDSTVATVSTTGLLKAVAAGVTTITATSGSAKAELLLSVDPGGFVGAAGGTISAFNGGVRLVVPPGALSSGTAIRLGPIAAVTPDPTFVRNSGGAVTLNGSFAIPAQLTLSYNPADLPAGLPESRLGLRVTGNNAWLPIAGGSVNAAAHTVTGSITGSGHYGVGMRPSETPCTAAEHRQFDFRIGAFNWAGPNNLTGEAEVVADAMGCTLRETLRISNNSEVRAVFFYEPSNREWHYTSIGGSVITRISGGRDGTRMVLYNPQRNSRVVWEELSGSSHMQAGESSTNGTSWTRGGAGTYTRKAVAANVLTPAGGRIVLAGGAVVLDAPAGAVSQNVTIDVLTGGRGGPLDPAVVRDGHYTLTTSPAVTFQQPVRLSLKYGPANGPLGVPESDFGIAVLNGARWENVAGSQADTAANTVTAAITAPGVFTARRVPASSCTEAEHRQFDFWIGEWDVNTVPSSITREASGCAIYEDYQAPLRGLSISVYDPRNRTWNQTYVTSNGGLLLLTGTFADGKMVLFERAPDGSLRSRWTWERIDANTVTQRAERTPDNGQSWLPQFLGTYRRR